MLVVTGTGIIIQGRGTAHLTQPDAAGRCSVIVSGKTIRLELRNPFIRFFMAQTAIPLCMIKPDVLNRSKTG
jgi:hypothetical protein